MIKVYKKILRWKFYLDFFLYDFKTKFHKNIKQNNKISKINKIHIVYFSCQKHFNYLLASLKSLKKLNSKNMGNIYLYIDKKDFLSDNQQNQLRKEFSFNILIRKTRYKMSWGGPKVIINELTAFKEILKDINSNDYLAKVDSDILFISDNIFKKIIKSKNLLIGQRITKENGLRYSSGGCYFLKSSIIPKITNYPLYNIIKKTIKQDRCRIDSIPEDLTIFNLVKKKTNKIDLRKDIFLLPLEKLDKILKKGKQKYSVIHFFKCKDDMLDVIKKL